MRLPLVSVLLDLWQIAERISGFRYTMSRQAAIKVQPIKVSERIDWQTPADRPTRDAAQHLTLSTVVLPAILLITYLAQCAWFIHSQSFTVDEPLDIRSGLEQWRTGQYSGGLGWNDHPPLARLLCTLP